MTRSLLDTPSHGESEVLDTLHYQGAIHGGVPLYRLGPLVAHRYGGAEDTAGSDPQFEADLRTVVGTLADAGDVVGQSPHDGSEVDLTSSPPDDTKVVLTGAGRARARHPRPRPVRIRES